MTDLNDFLTRWTDDPAGVKQAFEALHDILSRIDGATLSFIPRPPATHSLRAEPATSHGRPILALIDVVTDGPDRFLSVCFYADTVTDPDDLGNLIPNGLLAEDGYCFDLDAYDKDYLTYLAARIAEAAAAFSLPDEVCCGDIEE